MKPVLCLLLLCLAGCSAVTNIFEVKSKDDKAVSAVLRLCGTTTEMTKVGSVFTTIRNISCEGSGTIVVSFSDQPKVMCIVGYVTPPAYQAFRFIVEKGVCKPA